MRCRAVLAVVLLLGTACSRPDGTLVVFAASSMTDVFESLASGARFNFAGSDQLATQIREGARADVYVSASERYAAALASDGLADAPMAFATNRLVLIVPSANRARISGLEDLQRAGVRLIVGAPGVPVGDYTRAALQTLRASDVLDSVVSEEQDARALTGKVALGEADAGFVYATDVAPAGGRVRAIELPGGGPVVRYSIAVLRRAAHPAAARAFVARVTGAAGRAALVAAGFGAP